MDDTFIVTVFCIIDEVLVAANHPEHPLAQASDAEVLTVAVVAAASFANHHERALQVLTRLGYLSGPLSVSRFNRRIHRLGDWLLGILDLVGELFLDGEALFVIDSLPIPACHRARATRCRKVQGRRFYGYIAAKRQIFFGWRIHLVVTPVGIPVAVALLPASDHDLTCVAELLYPLPSGAMVVADKAYNSQAVEAGVLEASGVRLVPIRKAKMAPNTWLERQVLHPLRSRIESVNSQLEAMGIERLHARTCPGVEIKIAASLLALAWINIIAHAVPLAQQLLRPH
ncbi:MAG TPA: IS982 family transposase [Thermomicrobiales bacterium]|jgi:hypothetical protein|nr:IS982 family transposase [Thermomicrobiales bacterium]